MRIKSLRSLLVGKPLLDNHNSASSNTEKMIHHPILLCVLLCIAHIVSENLFSRLLKRTNSVKAFNRGSEGPSTFPRSLLPQLPPHKDTCYLLEFISDGSDHCAQMEPVVQRLEKDLRTKVRKINISRKHEFLKLYDCVGGSECGTVPFFYNRRTAQAICGATPYQNLKNLAMGKPIHFFNDAPQNIDDKVEHDPRRQRGVGWSDYLTEKLFTRGLKGKSVKRNK